MLFCCHHYFERWWLFGHNQSPCVMYGTWLLFQIWTKSKHSSLRYHNKDSKCMTQLPNWLTFGTKPNAILCALALHGIWLWYQILRKSIHASCKNVHGCTHKSNGQTDRPNPFLYSDFLIPLLQSRDYCREGHNKNYTKICRPTACLLDIISW